ncbi:hypothetical protein LCGC14_3013180, partial [marine sediment metagenome]
DGTMDTNGKTVTSAAVSLSEAGTKSLILGATVWNCTAWTYDGSNFTLTPNTSTIKVTGTGVFAGGGLTYNDVELNGTAHTISGGNTGNQLTFKDATTQTITFTDGTTQTFATYVITGESGKVKTLTGTSTGGWTITKTGGGHIDADYLVIDYSTATPTSTWYAGKNSTNGGNNSGWFFHNRLKRGWMSK